MMVERQPIRHLPKIEPGKEREQCPSTRNLYLLEIVMLALMEN